MKSKLAWAAFSVSLAAALPARLWRALLGGGGEWGALDVGAVAALGAGALLTVFSARRDRTVMRLPLRGRVLAGAYMAMGALLMAVSVVGVARAGTGRFPSMTAVCTLLAVFAGLVLFLQGCLFAAGGQNFAALHPGLALLPTFWCCLALVLQFRVNLAEVLKVQNVLQTAMLIFLLLALLSLAEMASGMRAVTRGRLYGWGLPAVACTACAAAPRLAQAGAGAQPQPAVPPGLLVLGLLFAAFLCVSLATVRPATREERVGDLEDEEQPSVRPVVMMNPPAVAGPRVHAGRRPVVASRDDPRPLTPTEAELRTQRVLVRYLQQAWDARCYFYHKTRSCIHSAPKRKSLQ